MPAGGAPDSPLFDWIPITPEHDEDEPEILELELAALTAHWRWHGVKGFLVELHYNLYMY